MKSLSFLLYIFYDQWYEQEQRPKKHLEKLDFLYRELLYCIESLKKFQLVKIPWVCRDFDSFMYFLEFDMLSFVKWEEYIENELIHCNDTERDSFLKIWVHFIDCIHGWRYLAKSERDMLESVLVQKQTSCSSMNKDMFDEID